MNGNASANMGDSLEVPMAFVIVARADDPSQLLDVQVFLSSNLDIAAVKMAAENFNRETGKAAVVILNTNLSRYRISVHESFTGLNEDEQWIMNIGDTPLAEEVAIEHGQRIPRPRNSWILFRQEKSAIIRAQNPTLSNSQISSVCSILWKNLSSVKKERFKEMAVEEDRKHKEMYPNYKFTTQKKKLFRKKRASNASNELPVANPGVSGPMVVNNPGTSGPMIINNPGPIGPVLVTSDGLQFPMASLNWFEYPVSGAAQYDGAF